MGQWLCGFVLLAGLTGCGVEGRDHLLQGQRLLQEGRPAEAIEPLQAAARAFHTNGPVAAQAWNYLGLAYHRAGHPTEAAQAYKAALDRDLNLFDARYNLGALFFEQGNFPAAIRELTSYTAHQPKDPAGWILLGRAQLRAGLLDAADRNLLQALRLNPTPLQQAAALNALGLGQVQRRRAREAFQYFEAALNRVTNYPPALLNQAVLSQQMQDRNFALQKFAAYLAVAGNAPNAEAIRALTNRLAEQVALALKPAAPTGPAPAALPGANGRTSGPPAVARVEPAAASVHTAAPPAQPSSATGTVAAATLPPGERPTKPRTPPEPAVTPEPRVQPSTAVAKTETSAPVQPPAVTATSPPPRVASAPTTPAPTPAGAEAVAKPPAETAPAEKAPPKDALAAKAPTESAAPPATQPAPATPAPETVELAAEPEIKPAVDVALTPPAPAKPPVTPPETPVARETTPAARPEATPAAAAPPAAQAAAAEPEPQRKRSFFARLNPLNLIRGEDSPEKLREREAKKAAEQARKAEKEARKEAARKPTTPVERKPAPAAATARRPESPRPVFARYNYTRPAAPAPGNRAEADRLVAEGLAAHKAGRLAEAQATYARAAQADPAHFPARFNLAVAAFEAGDLPRALTAYETALTLAPDDANARYGFALTLERAGYPLDAAAELEKILARDPRHVEAHLALANLCATTLDDRARAREHYLKVLQLQPNHPQAGQIKRWLGPAYRPGSAP
jgi:tetratricopeptide (TPR) repeat protein